METIDPSGHQFPREPQKPSLWESKKQFQESALDSPESAKADAAVTYQRCLTLLRNPERDQALLDSELRVISERGLANYIEPNVLPSGPSKYSNLSQADIETVNQAAQEWWGAHSQEYRT